MSKLNPIIDFFSPEVIETSVTNVVTQACIYGRPWSQDHDCVIFLSGHLILDTCTPKNIITDSCPSRTNRLGLGSICPMG